MELEYREFIVRSVDEERRSVSGIAVPFNEEAQIGEYRESFARGAFADHQGTVPFYYGHDHRTGGLPVGKAEVRESEDALEADAYFSDTVKANEVYTLVRDGVLTKFSIGFQPLKSEKRNGVVVRTAARLHELSIVGLPAYPNAAVSKFRSDADNHNEKESDVEMSESVIAPEVAEIREAVSDLERKFAGLQTSTNEVKESGSKYRSGGEILKGLYTGDQDAKVEVRAFTGATSADNDDATRPAWINEQLKLVAAKQPVMNLFTRKPLPADGLSYVYPVVTGRSGSVAKQATEGADLNYVEVTTGTATATIDTYGGYTSLSRQLIERSEISFLDYSLRNLFNEYAIASEKAVRDKLVAATGIQTENLGTADTAANWVGVILDSAALIEDNAQGAVAEVVVVSRDVFRRMATITDGANGTGRNLFEVNGDGVNTIGSLNAVRVAGTVAGFQVVVIPTLPANSLYVVSSEAITVRSDGPTSLQDENIINLTKDFAVYGYMAVEVNNPLAIVKVDADLSA